MASEQISSFTSGTAATALSSEPEGGADVEGEVSLPAGAEAFDAEVGLVVDARAGTALA